MANVTFDGPNKLIIVDFGVTTLDAQVDLYSDWKEWVRVSDNSKYLQALRTVAGDPTTGTQAISPYFFLMNGWLIRPHEADHELDVDGNLYGDEGQSLFTPTLGGYTVTVKINRSVNAVTEVIGGGGGSEWDEAVGDHATPGTFGALAAQTGTDAATAAAGVGSISAAVAAMDVVVNQIDVRVILAEKILRNRMQLLAGSSKNMIVYDDDGVTPLLVGDVTGPSGEPITIPVGAQANRSRLE